MMTVIPQRLLTVLQATTRGLAITQVQATTRGLAITQVQATTRFKVITQVLQVMDGKSAVKYKIICVGGIS